MNELNQLAIGHPTFNSPHAIDIQPPDQPVFVVVNVDVPRHMVSDEPFENITAAPDFAHSSAESLPPEANGLGLTHPIQISGTVADNIRRGIERAIAAVAAAVHLRAPARAQAQCGDCLKKILFHRSSLPEFRSVRLAVEVFARFLSERSDLTRPASFAQWHLQKHLERLVKSLVRGHIAQIINWEEPKLDRRAIQRPWNLCGCRLGCDSFRAMSTLAEIESGRGRVAVAATEGIVPAPCQATQPSPGNERAFAARSRDRLPDHTRGA